MRTTKFSSVPPLFLLGLSAWLIGHLALSPALGAREIPFSTQQVIDLSYDDARSVQIVDVDGDGDLDIAAVAQGTQDDVGWFENTAGDGSSWTERLISDGLINPGWARAGDFDGDGDIDMVATDLGDTGNTGKVVWFENTGAYGAAWPQSTIDIFNGVEPVEVGDLDGDGDLDVVASSFLVDDIRWYENLGGTWAPFRLVDSQIKGKNLAIEDVDGDGDLDVAVGAPVGFGFGDTSKLGWLENPGPAAIAGASSWTRRQINPSPFDGARGICIADLDLDGDMDAAGVADGGAGDAVAWFENSGDNSTFAEHTLDTGFLDPKVIFCVDMDEDGDADLLSVSNGGSGVAWYENPRQDLGWPSHTIQLVFTNGQNVWAGDVDGDGRQDVAAVSRNDIVSWWRNEEIQRNSAFPRSETVDSDHQGASAVALGDLDGDGVLDLAAAASTESKLTAYRRDGGLMPQGSTWTSLADVTTTTADIRALAVGDTDADGDLDILAAVDGATDAVQIFENSAGDGTSWSAAGTLGASDAPRDLALADLDGDGDPDVLVSANGSDAFAWLKNDGTTGPWASTAIIDGVATYDGAFGIAAVDLDADGDLDVVATAEMDGDVLAFENTSGTGSTWSSTLIDGSVDGPTGIAAGDLDGDGDADVVSAAAAGNDVLWFENTSGDGTAWSTANIAVDSAGGAMDIGLEDLDGDGDLDVLVAESTDDELNWYENTSGDGSTWTVHPLSSTSGGAEGLALGDLDRNGLADVALAASASSDVFWLGNFGGQFALPTTDVAPVALGDSTREEIFRLEATHNGRLGENDLQLAAIEIAVSEQPSGQPLNSTEAQTLLQSVEVWLDDGDDSWEDGIDTLLGSASPPVLDENGILAVALPQGDPDGLVAVGTPRTYFVAIETTSDFSSGPFASFALTHVTLGSSRAEDALRQTALRLEGTTPVMTSEFEVNPSGIPEADVELLMIEGTPDPVDAGEEVTYEVSIGNNGAWAAEDVEMTSTLPVGSTFVSTIGCLNDPAGFPDCELGEVRLGEPVVVSIVVGMGMETAGDVTYGASVSSTTPDPMLGNNTGMEATTVLPPGDLSAGTGATLAPRVGGGYDVVYRVAARNLGGIDEPNATLTDSFPSELQGETWTCQAFGGASCPAPNGSGDLDEVLDLPVGGIVGFTIVGTISVESGTLSNSATVNGVDDDNASNDTSMHSIGLSGLLIADGFESGDTQAWDQP